MNTIGQIIGFIYLGVFVFSFQFKNKRTLMNWRMLSKVLASIHYILIGALSGFISQFVNIFPNYYAYKYEKSNKKYMIAGFFIIVFIVLGVLTYKNIYDTLPIIGSILTIISMFKKGTKCIRTWQFIISPMFLIYNIVSVSYAGILTEILILVSCTIGIQRLDKHKTT